MPNTVSHLELIQHVRNYMAGVHRVQILPQIDATSELSPLGAS